MANAPGFLTQKPTQGQQRVLAGSITVNCLEITRLPQNSFYHYDDIEKDAKLGDLARWQLIQRMQVAQPNIFNPQAIYDGRKNLFSSHELQFTDRAKATYHVTLPGGKKEIRITLTLVGTINPAQLQALHPPQWNENRNARLTSITLLNVLVRMEPLMSSGTVAKGRAFLTNVGKKQTSSGLEFWNGYFQSVRQAPGHLVLNVDTTIGLVYRTGDVIDLLLSFLGARDVRDLDGKIRSGRSSGTKSSIKQFLKHLKVRFIHRPGARERPISTVIWESAETHTFVEEASNEELSVADYFARKNRPLRFPDLPILAKFGQRSAVPLELLAAVEGQIYRGAIPERVQQEMIKVSTRRPTQKLNDLQHSLTSLSHQTSSYMRHAGMQVGTQFMRVNARVLRPPTLQLGQNRRVELNLADKSKVGAWNMTDKVVWRPAQFHTLVGVRTTTRFVRFDMIQQLRNIWRSMGIDFPEFKGIDCLNPPINQALDSEIGPIWDSLTDKQKRCLVVLVIVEDSDKEKRDCIKWWGDMHRGVITQVVKVSKFQDRGFDQYARNLGLKINAKSRGINYAPLRRDLAVMGDFDKTMVIGLDTSHPPPGSLTPTTVALVYSIDPNAIDYRCKVKFQEPRQELVKELSGMVSAAIRNFYDNSKHLPTKIIFYRDGVSEGQFDQVAKSEIEAILDTLKFVSQTTKRPQPTLTFIVVGKKHHIRFFPSPDLADAKENALPGTVIDTDITTPEPNQFDFYLQSHAGLIGTSRPAHYTVLYDDIHLSADSLQQFSHDLCHVYQIATRSVSIPAPVYYADKIAARFAIFSYRPDGDTVSMASSDERSWKAWEPHIEAMYKSFEARNNDTFDRMFWL